MYFFSLSKKLISERNKKITLMLKITHLTLLPTFALFASEKIIEL
jgi:hypothetical protein